MILDNIKKRQFFISNKEKINKFYKISKNKNEIMGKGKYGIIMKATNKITNETKVVKIIKKKNYNENFTAKNNLNEYNILKKLDHPNIVNSYELFEDKKYFYLIFEFLKGGDILTSLKQNKNFNENKTKEIMFQLFNTINYLHSKNICHRDIKLENIMFVSNNSNFIKLIDFGISKKFKKEKMKNKKGSALYFSPELIDGQYSESVDIWSAGVVMFSILAGYPPFVANNMKDLIKKIKNLDYSFNDKIWGDISFEAKDLIKKLLCKKEKRLNPNQILNHPWFNNRSSVINNNLKINNFLNYFNNPNAFQRIILNNLAYQSKINKNNNDLQNIFIKLDKNNKGKISTENLFKSLTHGNENFNALKLRNKNLFKKKITFNEFKAIFLNTNEIDNIDLLLWDIFKKIDINNNGLICKNEILDYIKKIFNQKNINHFDFYNINNYDFIQFKNLFIKYN